MFALAERALERDVHAGAAAPLDVAVHPVVLDQEIALQELERGLDELDTRGCFPALLSKIAADLPAGAIPRELLDSGRCDVVSVATPNHTHALLGVWAALYHARRTQCTQAVRPSPVKIIRAFAAAAHSVAVQAKSASLLLDELSLAVLADESRRKSSKQSRAYPRKKRPKACGPPNVTTPTTLQIKYAKLFGLR